MFVVSRARVVAGITGGGEGSGLILVSEIVPAKGFSIQVS